MPSSTIPRISPLPRDGWTEAARDVFGYWEGPTARAGGSRSNTLMTLANHPPLALPTLDLGKYFMLDSTLGARQLKMVILRVAHLFNSPYQWAHNSIGARQIGMSGEQIDAIRTGPEASIWAPEDRALLLAVDGTCDGGRFDEETWTHLAGTFDKTLLMDIILAAGYFTMIAWGLVAMRVQLEPDFEDFSMNLAKSE